MTETPVAGPGFSSEEPVSRRGGLHVREDEQLARRERAVHRRARRRIDPGGPGEDPTTGPTVDEAFLAEACERLEERIGERLVDLAETPTRRPVVPVDGPALDRSPDLHPELDTRVVQVDGAGESTHALDQLETRTGLELSLVDGDPQAPFCQLV